MTFRSSLTRFSISPSPSPRPELNRSVLGFVIFAPSPPPPPLFFSTYSFSSPISYTYDLTSTLQANLTGVRTSSSSEPPSSTNPDDYRSAFRINTRYMWNYRLLKDAFPEINEEGTSWKGNLGGSLEGGGAGGTGGWVLPLVHGFVDQASEYERSGQT